LLFVASRPVAALGSLERLEQHLRRIAVSRIALSVHLLSATSEQDRAAVQEILKK
jgi:hypothetical protein